MSQEVKLNETTVQVKEELEVQEQEKNDKNKD